MSERSLSRKERLLARLRELGADPKRSLGQNFLISDVVVDRIVAAAKSEQFTEMIEVGPGLGALTEDLIRLAQSCGTNLTLVELDRSFAEQWRQRAMSVTLAASASPALSAVSASPALSPASASPALSPASASPALRVIEGDALRLDWRTFGLKPGALLVSNLPYQISSSLVIELSLEPAGISRMILMFQKEVAQRIGSRARTGEYGLLTVIAQAFWETATVTDAGPNDFYPPPNVASRVLSFRRRANDPISAAIGSTNGGAIGSGAGVSRGDFLKFVKAAFSHRRKLMLKNLTSGYFGGDHAKSQRAEAILAEMGHPATARAEELDPSSFIRLYLAFHGVDRTSN